MKYFILFITGSGWVIDGLKSLQLNITKYTPMRIGRYMPLPPNIKNKQSLLNLQNQDNQ